MSWTSDCALLGTRGWEHVQRQTEARRLRESVGDIGVTCGVLRATVNLSGGDRLERDPADIAANRRIGRPLRIEVADAAGLIG